MFDIITNMFKKKHNGVSLFGIINKINKLIGSKKKEKKKLLTGLTRVFLMYFIRFIQNKYTSS